MPNETQAKVSIAETLLHLSIDLEDHNDLVANLAHAFDTVRESL
nr:hypothetical protein [Candidatus Enterovibrio luxaltus]